MEKREHFCTVGGNVTCAVTMENSMESSQKLKIGLPYDPALPLLGVYAKKRKTLIQKDTYSPLFIAPRVLY